MRLFVYLSRLTSRVKSKDNIDAYLVDSLPLYALCLSKYKKLYIRLNRRGLIRTLRGDQSHQWSSYWRRKWSRIDGCRFGVEESPAGHVGDV